MKLPVPTKSSTIMLLGLMALLFASALACNLPINLSPNEISPVEDIQPPDLEPTETTVIQVQRETAQAGSSEPTEDTDSGSTPDSPDIAPAPDLTIQPGEAPAIPDCNVFDMSSTTPHICICITSERRWTNLWSSRSTA